MSKISAYERAAARPIFPALVMSLAGAVVLASGLFSPARRVTSMHPALGNVNSTLSQLRLNAAMKVAGAAGFVLLVVAELARRERNRRRALVATIVDLPPQTLSLPAPQKAGR